jgi:hypothetical protein
VTIPKSIAQRVRTATLVLVSASFGSLLTGIAFAQPYHQANMVGARNSVQQAINYLSQANADKGGHRVNALNFCRQAIREINLGIRYANGR